MTFIIVFLNYSPVIVAQVNTLKKKDPSSSRYPETNQIGLHGVQRFKVLPIGLLKNLSSLENLETLKISVEGHRNGGAPKKTKTDRKR